MPKLYIEFFIFLCYTILNTIKASTGEIMKLSLIVPCYNEEACIKAFYAAYKKAFDGTDYKRELIFINDGSTDSTLSLLKKIYLKSEEDINIISFSKNFGKEAAMYAGLKAAKGEYICFIDADLQQRPELVVKMVSLLEKHREYDCIATYSKSSKSQDKLTALFKGGFYRIMSKMSGMEFVDGASDFRCFRRNMADAILSVSEYHRFTKGLFSWVGFNTRYVPYEVANREGGNSKWTLGKLFSYSFEGIIAFSNKPLRWPIYFGLPTSIFGLIYLIFYLIFALAMNHNFSPSAVLLALLIFFGGAILVSIGILGEYVGKIHTQVKNRPIYIASEIYKSENKAQNSEIIRSQLEYELQREQRIKQKKAKLKEKRRRERVQEEIELQKHEQETARLEEEKQQKKKQKKKSKKEENKPVTVPDSEGYSIGPDAAFEEDNYSAGPEAEFEDDE